MILIYFVKFNKTIFPENCMASAPVLQKLGVKSAKNETFFTFVQK